MSDFDEFDGYTIESINPIWKLHPYLPLSDAAALIAGYEPMQIGRCQRDTWFDQGFPDYRPTVLALVGAVLVGDLGADIAYVDVDKEDNIRLSSEGFWERINNHISASGTRIRKADLLAWMEANGHRPEFFFPDKVEGEPDFLSPQHPRYAPKLAAAVRAW